MNILFLGNGFDLYHNLKTSYKDFLKILKNPSRFASEVNNYVKHSGNNDNYHYDFYEYFNNCESINTDLVNKMCNILKDNSWAQYYANCNADIQGWIDFENEMTPVFDFFREIFKLEITSTIRRTDRPYYKLEQFKLLRQISIAEQFSAFFIDEGHYRFAIKPDFLDMNYGLLTNKIIDTLIKDLDNFIMAYTIYLQVFIEPVAIDKYSWIDNIKPDRIISFNYTQTEKYYFSHLESENISHIHGTVSCGNLVFGNDLITDNDVDFLRFGKKYQRLTKVDDYSFIDFLDEAKKSKGNVQVISLSTKKSPPKNIDNNINVSFIGCSLDKNDSPIFEQYIKDADKVTIYCYGSDGFNDATNNLINIFGTDIILKWKHEKKLVFLDIKGVLYEQEPLKIIPKVFYLANKTALLSN